MPARTIRFYIAKGLVPPPLVGGRAARYGEEHVKELDRIKTLQEEGQTLAQIAWQLGERPKEVSSPEPSSWWNYPVSKDVVVQVSCDSSPRRLKQVRSLIAQMIQQLNENEGGRQWAVGSGQVGNRQKAENAGVAQTAVFAVCGFLLRRRTNRGPRKVGMSRYSLSKELAGADLLSKVCPHGPSARESS